jgi:Na+/H+-dicarboxylate symporter
MVVVANYVSDLPKPTASAFIENLLPSNPVMPFLQGNVLQLILFAVLFGTAIKMAGQPAEPVANFFFALNKVVYQITALVIWCAPYGIFALIAWTVGHFGLAVITPLLTLVGTVYLGCAVLLFVVYVIGLTLFSKVKPLQFYKGMFPALTFAFTSSSSAATLPLTMQCAENKLGLPAHITKFLLPLGTSFNLNGLSVYLSVATVFAANLYGIHMGLQQYLTVIITITITAMGAAAVPGSALIVMGAVMSAVGIPLNGIAVIAGVDRLNDMIQTSTNVAGDVFVSVLVSEGEEKIPQEISATDSSEPVG